MSNTLHVEDARGYEVEDVREFKFTNFVVSDSC